jgi:hypothetical protein
MTCVCQHPQSEHGQEGCEAVVAPGAFCSCSGYRTIQDGRLRMDPAFRARVREGLGDKWLPDWTAYARCKSAELHDGGLGPNRPGQPFVELTDKDDLKDAGEGTRLPERSLLFQIERLCARCPVRRECLHYAYQADLFNHNQPGDEDVAVRAFGVYGGVPGRLREHFRHDEEGANAWFEALRETEGWAQPTGREEQFA